MVCQWAIGRSGADAIIMHARFQPTDAAGDDEFYADADFVWDFYNEVINQQDSLYHDDDYRYVLVAALPAISLFPSGSRPEIRQASGPLAQSTFTPRRIRAIPHNAILQQLAMPTNVIFGIGRAGVLTRTASGCDFPKIAARAHHYGYGDGQLATIRICKFWPPMAIFKIRIFGFRAPLASRQSADTLAISHRRAPALPAQCQSAFAAIALSLARRWRFAERHYAPGENAEMTSQPVDR